MSTVVTETHILQKMLEGHTDLGLVPTMGNLHCGHLSLLKECMLNNPLSVISIFVNPTQFGQGEDFSSYPRTIEADLEKISQLESELNQTVIVFIPQDEQQIYPENQQTIEALGPTLCLEGVLRPGHFNGVATVVKRLFEIVRPTRAYFGKKDYQQLKVIEALNKKFQLGIEIIGMPIIREDSGLAMSSRNSYLNHAEKQEALTLRQSLLSIKALLENEGLFKPVHSHIKELLKDKRFNYLSLCDSKTLSPATELSSKLVVLGNFQVGKTKLLDNLEININEH